MPDRPTATLGELTATRLAFLIAGLATVAWAPIVPYAKGRVGLDEGALGLLLLCLGLGSIITMPVAGALVTRFGCRRAIGPAVVTVAMALPLLSFLSSFPNLALALSKARSTGGNWPKNFNPSPRLSLRQTGWEATPSAPSDHSIM